MGLLSPKSWLYPKDVERVASDPVGYTRDLIKALLRGYDDIRDALSSAGGSNWFYASSSANDHGATSGRAKETVYDIATYVGISKYAIIVLSHDPANGNTTTYTFDTSLDLSSYQYLYFLIEPGAILSRTTGDETVTFPSPENLVVGKRQKITSVDMIAFGTGGVVYPQWWGAIDDGSTDCTNAIQWAIDTMYDAGSGTVSIPISDTHYKITSEIHQLRQVSVIGEGYPLCYIKNTTNTNSLWTIGNSSTDVNGDFCVLKNISFHSSSGGSSTAGISILGAVDDGLTTASRFWRLENILVTGQGKKSLRISGYSGVVDNFKVTSWSRGLELGNESNDIKITRFNCSSDTEFAIVSTSSLTNPPLNVAFYSTVVQHHNHASYAAILIDSGYLISFDNLYLEHNYDGGSTSEIIIGSDAHNVILRNITRTDAQSSDICISCAADGLIVDGLWDNTSALYTIEFAGSSASNASIKNVYRMSASLQAIVHDRSTTGVVYETRPNIIPNAGFLIVDGGTSWTNPANGTTVFDVWEVGKADGGGTAPSVDIARDTTTPNYKVLYSCKLDITNVGVADASRSWKLIVDIPDPALYRGEDVYVNLIVKASTTIDFTASAMTLADSSDSTSKAISSVTTTWASYHLIHAVTVSATSLEFQYHLDTGGGTISTTGSLYITAIIGAAGRNPASFMLPLKHEAQAYVDYITP